MQQPFLVTITTVSLFKKEPLFGKYFNLNRNEVFNPSVMSVMNFIRCSFISRKGSSDSNVRIINPMIDGSWVQIQTIIKISKI
jgi:hypothetical protein